MPTVHPLQFDTFYATHDGYSPKKGKTAGTTVLVCDDEPAILRMMRLVLESAGYSVLCAASGAEAVGLFASGPDDIGLVLVDLTMPGMDGEQALRELQRIRPHVKAVLCSGYGLPEVGSRFSSEGWFGFLRKPLELEALLNVARDAVSVP